MTSYDASSFVHAFMLHIVLDQTKIGQAVIAVSIPLLALERSAPAAYSNSFPGLRKRNKEEQRQ
jgi:hypothetical protein